MKLHLKVIGKGKKIVLLHGFGFNSECFNALVEKLSSQYQCYLIDLPGFGQSIYQPYDLKMLLTSMHAILPKKICFLGWSLGGSIALAYARKYPDYVRSLILISTNPLFVTEKDWPSMELSTFKKFENECRNNIKKALKNFIMLQFPKGQICKITYKKLMTTIDFDSLKMGAVLNALTILKTHDLRQVYQEIEMPILSIYGKNDQLVPSLLVKSLTLNCKKNHLIYMFENSAHIPFMTEEERFISIINNFYVNDLGNF